MPQPLPIDALLPQIAATLRTSRDLIVEAAPGAGKTTRVPPALLELGGEVLVLEPRRIAARMAARRVAEELGERPGETVGYQVRFEEIAGPKTRLRFLTEGVFTRRLLRDPTLRHAGTIILDEFHERHIDTDLALALLRRLQKTRRPDLRLVIMSATLSTEPLARFLGDCPVIRSEGRLFDLTITRARPYSPAPLEQQVASAFDRLAGTGDILTFLPGAAEIRRAASACTPIAQRRGYALTPLHGDLSPTEQDRAVAPGPQPKLILSTNVAESSITIEGVRAVIDSGLARIASDSPWTGIPSLRVDRVSQASARQRLRDAPGVPVPARSSVSTPPKISIAGPTTTRPRSPATGSFRSFACILKPWESTIPVNLSGSTPRRPPPSTPPNLSSTASTPVALRPRNSHDFLYIHDSLECSSPSPPPARSPHCCRADSRPAPPTSTPSLSDEEWTPATGSPVY